MSHKQKMDRREFLRKFPKAIMIGVASAYTLKSFGISSGYEAFKKKPGLKKDPSEILKEIYKEVIEFGKKDNEDFIKREFHMDLDDDEKNREEHVVVLIYSVGDWEKMIVQVTYFETRGSSIIIKHARDIRVVSCFIKRDRIEIGKFDYKEKEIGPLLQDVLQGIRDEKKLLKLIDRKIDDERM